MFNSRRNRPTGNAAAPYLVALLALWAVPAGGWLVLSIGVERWLEEAWLAWVHGSVVATLLSVVVLPAIALSQAGTALDRWRARRRPPGDDRGPAPR